MTEEIRNNLEHENLNDVIITQCILCVLLVIIFLVINIFIPETGTALIEKYKSLTGNPSDEVLADAVKKVTELIK